MILPFAGPSARESEIQFKRELNLARICNRAKRFTERTQARWVEGRRWVLEISMVEQVKELAAELQTRSFGKDKTLEHAEVYVLDSRSVKHTRRASTERPSGWKRE